MKKTLLSILLLLPLLLLAQGSYNISIPVRSNAWANNESTKAVLRSGKMEQWSNPEQIINLYFYITKACKLPVAIEMEASQTAELKIKVAGKTFLKQVSASGSKIELGEINFKKAGHYKMTIQGKKRSGSSYGNLQNVLLAGDATLVKFIDQENTYFGRRGPSVHLAYTIPENISETEWYYSEIEVPKGQDQIGSYYMANGFGEGYFGIQVNSPTERRVLFSVWSPFHTDDPKAIPDEEKIVLLKKGEKVISGEFGNEGSGGQSFMRFPWKAGVRYGFLLRGIPDGKNNTTYTAWFHDPETKQWMLMASFKRPKTNTYLKRFHSFLENFIPDQGDKTRMANYSNQWVADSKGNWYPVTEATFTYDATAHAQRRFDYAGGVTKKGFFLKMGGFFDQNTTYRTKFKSLKSFTKPDINLADFK